MAKYLADEASKAAVQRRVMMYTGSVDDAPCALSRARRRTCVDIRSRLESTLPASDLHAQLAAVLAELSDLKCAVAALTSNSYPALPSIPETM